MTTPTFKSKGRLIATVLFSALQTALLVFTIGALNGWWMDGAGLGYGGLLIAFAILAALLILLVTLLVLTVFNIRGNEPSQIHAYAWMPSLLVLGGALIVVGIKEAQHNMFAQAHPDISEVHVNLSGKYAWALDSDMEMPVPQTEFAWTTRYAQQGLEKMTAYDGWRIAPSFTQAEVHMKAGPVNNTNVETPLVKLPVVPPSRYPDVASLIPLIKANGYGYTPTEASLLEYQYHYYADRIEVVPAITLSGSDRMALWGSNLPITGVYVENAYAKPIARIEIDGDALRIGQQPLTPPDESCSRRNYTNYVMNRFDQPVKVRWQFLEPNPAWREATVRVPDWTSPSPKGWQIREDVVFLYLQADGSIASQRQLEMMVRDKHGQDTIGIRTTPIQPALKAVSHCGTADDRWTETAVRFPS
jgi:heme/copper-type cytochrome/quinol oxidase subunit 2